MESLKMEFRVTFLLFLLFHCVDLNFADTDSELVCKSFNLIYWIQLKSNFLFHICCSLKMSTKTAIEMLTTI